MANADSIPACKNLVLDAGPLLSLSPLRGLAETYYIVPQVLSELKDKRAREHFERLGLSAGVRIQVQNPDAASLAHVIQWAKKTGDYSVLSHADLCVLALTYALDVQEKEIAKKSAEEASQDASATAGPSNSNAEDSGVAEMEEAQIPEDEHVEEPPASDTEASEPEPEPEQIDDAADSVPLENEDRSRDPLYAERHQVDDQTPEPEASTSTSSQATTDPLAPAVPADKPAAEPLYDDPSDEDDGEGEWITSSNVALHKSRALQLLPSADARKGKGKGKLERIMVGCMTADFAMQNVLLQMGLGLVGVEGKRIERVKSWVLRCHACFKICKDNSRKFCPSCGNPTLLRASVTISSPSATADTPILQVHLKKNFQFKTRGTIYSIPAPKAGSAKTGAGEGLILREDQTTWLRAKKHADGKREREERRLLTAASRGANLGEGGAVLGSWMDPDWVPEILSAGASGKGRNVRRGGMDGDMPVIGYGKKNPNERKRRK
ncbi:hypothetical protein CERSUDRAFT_91703 [Gelatoporia subvermispora B]|uniref:20S-pre-rRNA D-site endonuclease NOB1 n=1 Tax=Ceriporiopsis subvermispora (strain B) TaxID=914234 RepID=M2RQ18_CERS8|nr:hypothetical protein CERSUDRAFT_91703 [Gelatoporia subvermispora B]